MFRIDGRNGARHIPRSLLILLLIAIGSMLTIAVPVQAGIDCAGVDCVPSSIRPLIPCAGHRLVFPSEGVQCLGAIGEVLGLLDGPSGISIPFTCTLWNWTPISQDLEGWSVKGKVKTDCQVPAWQDLFEDVPSVGPGEVKAQAFLRRITSLDPLTMSFDNVI